MSNYPRLDSGPHIMKLQDRIAELEEENRQLRTLLHEDPGYYPFRATFGLTGVQSSIAQTLLRREAASLEQLMTAIYPDQDERFERDPGNIKVQINKMRSKLKPFGIQIESVWGNGYKFTEESKSRLRTAARFLKQAAE